MGIDVGGTNLKFGLVTKNGKIVKRKVLPSLAQQGYKIVLGQIVKGIRELSEEAKGYEILGLGIGTPGLVDSVNGIVYDLTNIPGWKNVNLRKILEKEFGLRVFVDNDVNLMALGEWACGRAKGAENIVCLTLGTGVGGGIIINGELYRGKSLTAGEIGHIPINYKGPKCICGNLGCLERYIGNKYIVERARKYIAMEKKTILKGWIKNGASLTPELIARGAKVGDSVCIKIWEDVAECLASALSGIINFLNPEKIIIGGGVSKAGRVLFEPLRKKVKEKAMGIPGKDVKILTALLGEDAGIIGAAMLVFLKNQFFS